MSSSVGSSADGDRCCSLPKRRTAFGADEQHANQRRQNDEGDRHERAEERYRDRHSNTMSNSGMSR